MPLPAAVTVTHHTLWTASFCKLTIDTGVLSGLTFTGTLEIIRSGYTTQYALDFAHPSNSSSDILTQMRAVAVGLAENTAYTLRITFKTYSGGVLQNTYTQDESITTLNSSVTTGTSTTYYWDTETGNNSDSGLTPELAKLTLGALDTLMGPGKSILLASVMNPDPSTTANFRYQDSTGSRSGNASNWVRLAPAGSSSELRGYRALDGGWSLESGTTDVWKKSLDDALSARRRVEKVYDVTAGEMLPLHYSRLSADSGGFYGIKANTIPGVHLEDADTSQSILYVRKITNPTVEPATGELIGAYTKCMMIDDVDYCLIENLTFKMSGQTKTTDPPTNEFIKALECEDCNYVIIRNCVFDHAHLVLENCTYVLVENCTFRYSGIWSRTMAEAVNDPYEAQQVKGWSGTKNSYGDQTGLGFLGTNTAVEVRRCTFTESQIVGNSITVESVYIHGNTTSKHADEFVEFDGSTVNGLVVACNRIIDTHNFCSFVPGTEGVAWLFGNYIENPLLTAYKTGGNTAALSNMRREFVNNTVVMDRARTEDVDGSFRWIGLTGNVHFTNCIWVLNSATYMMYYESASANSNTTFDSCLFFSSAGAIRWRYQNTNYDDGGGQAGWEKLTAAQAGELELTNIETSINPYPFGWGNATAPSRLIPLSTAYHGVTNLATAEGGVRIPETVLPYGAFGGIRFEDVFVPDDGYDRQLEPATPASRVPGVTVTPSRAPETATTYSRQ